MFTLNNLQLAVYLTTALGHSITRTEISDALEFDRLLRKGDEGKTKMWLDLKADEYKDRI